MAITPVLVVTTILLLLGCWLWSRRRFYTLHAKLSGPLGLPFIGIAWQIRKPAKFLTYLEKVRNEYKLPFVVWLGPSCTLYVSDPETVELILKSPSCTSKGYMYRFLASIIGDGILTSSSPLWNKHRRLLDPSFGRIAIESFLPVFNQEVNVMVNKLSAIQGESLELYQLFKKFILQISCQTTMGQKMNFQNDGSVKLFNAYAGTSDIWMKRVLSPWLYPNVIYQYSGLLKCQQQCVSTMYEFIEKLLRGQKNASIEPARGSVSDKETVLHAVGNDKNQYDDGIIKRSKLFIDSAQNFIQEGKLTFEEVRDEANVVIAATFETTATVLYFVCLCLGMHPECQEKLYNELVALFPDSDKELNLSEVTKDHLEHMTYTEMVINEAMRLFSPVPVVLRNASEDFHLCDGTVVPRGTQIAIDIFNMNRSEQVWGPYARSFDPERHFGATSPQQHPYAFVPFTKGLRMCIGHRYALMLMKVSIAKIFRHFRVHTDAQMSDLEVIGAITLKIPHYPPCKFVAIEGSVL